MAYQNEIIASGVLSENDVETDDGGLIKPAGQVRKSGMFWRNVIIMSVVHVFFVGGFWMFFTGKVKWQTYVLSIKNKF
jgi:hypothetical protein